MDKTQLLIVRVACGAVALAASGLTYHLVNRDPAGPSPDSEGTPSPPPDPVGQAWNQVTQGEELSGAGEAKIQVAGGDAQVLEVLETGGGEPPADGGPTPGAVAPADPPAPVTVAVDVPGPAVADAALPAPVPAVAGSAAPGPAPAAPEPPPAEPPPPDPDPVVTRGDPFKADTVLNGNIFPYRLVAAPGWFPLEGEGDLGLSLRDGLEVFFYVAPPDAGTNANAFATAEIKRMRDRFEGHAIQKQEMVRVGGKAWGRFDLGTTGERTLVLYTHASKKGRYSVLVHGRRSALAVGRKALDQLLKSFRFPADNLISTHGDKAKPTIVIDRR